MFKMIKEGLNSNNRLLEVLDSHNLIYTVKKGEIRLIENTNLKIVIPTIYEVTNPFNLEILEYELTEKSNRPIYVKSLNQKFNLKELEKVKANNDIYSLMDIEKNYSKEKLENLILKLFEVCKENKIINRMYIDEGKLIDSYLVVPKMKEC